VQRNREPEVMSSPKLAQRNTPTTFQRPTALGQKPTYQPPGLYSNGVHQGSQSYLTKGLRLPEDPRQALSPESSSPIPIRVSFQVAPRCPPSTPSAKLCLDSGKGTQEPSSPLPQTTSPVAPRCLSSEPNDLWDTRVLVKLDQAEYVGATWLPGSLAGIWAELRRRSERRAPGGPPKRTLRRTMSAEYKRLWSGKMNLAYP
ncbi:hypothetical protein PIB30_083863, partial [Stylosanthes scabra]|nr:hypothetical protein [Stylosanthes scabra]